MLTSSGSEGGDFASDSPVFLSTCVAKIASSSSILLYVLYPEIKIACVEMCDAKLDQGNQ
jgi:hypothetical protein